MEMGDITMNILFLNSL